MTALISELRGEPWRRRLYLPAYLVSEAARYAGVSPKTVSDWHLVDGRGKATLSKKAQRSSLSYLQLIEVAVVAAFRKAGVSLKKVREAREYVAQQLHSEFPFAEYRFRTDGKQLWMDYQQVDGDHGKGKLLAVNQRGQLAWEEVIGRLLEFEYEDGGIAVRWHVAGQRSAIVIDPRIAFGAPTIHGIPTWVLSGRWSAGESLADIANDFALKVPDVQKALEFEGMRPDSNRPNKWLN